MRITKKTRVLVLMGGKSSEHEVSLMTGQEVIKNLDAEKFSIFSFLISRDSSNLKSLQTKIEQVKPDIVFIAMHGPFGEDGTIQGMLEMLGVIYIGSGVLASAIGMDKIIFKKLMQAENIPTPRWLVVNPNQEKINLKIFGKPPYFIKPSDQGSSVGASIANNANEVRRSLKNAFKYSSTALVEEYLTGMEVTCSVMGNKNPVALPVIEICLVKGNFFDYESKYSESGAKEIVPAGISKEMTDRIQKLAIKVYQTVGARGFSRIDFIIKDNQKPMVLEINTIPGLTPQSLFPKAAKAAGMSYSELLDKIIKYGLEEHH